LLLAGVEAVGWPDLHRLIDAGRLPTLARLVETGASGRFDPVGLNGPGLFAALATGRPPAEHGIAAPLEPRPDGGGVQPVGARSWRAAPFWQTLAEAGFATAVIGAPGVAPATAWPGCVIDERYAQPLGAILEDWPLPPGCVAPPALREALRPLRVHPEELDGAVRGNLPAAPLARAASNHAAATYVAEHLPWDLLVVHHALLQHDQSDAAFAFLDAMLARLVELAGPAADIIVLSPEGVLIAAGPGFLPDTILHQATVYDLAATVLARFGLMADGAPGRPLGAALGPLRRVSTARRLDPLPAPLPAAQRLLADQAYEATLHAAQAALFAGDYPTAVAQAQAASSQRPDDLRALSMLGQGQFLLRQAAACRSTGARLAALAPSSPWGPLLLGAALMLDGAPDAAGPHLDTARTLATDDPALLVRLGAILLHSGHPETAAAHYRDALALDPANADARAGLGLVALAANDAKGAERELRAAIGLRYHAPALHHALALALAAQHRWPDAARAAQTALAQNPSLPGAAALLRHAQDQIAAALTSAVA